MHLHESRRILHENKAAQYLVRPVFSDILEIWIKQVKRGTLNVRPYANCIV